MPGSINEAVQNNDEKAIAIIAKDEPRVIVEQTHNDNTALHEAARMGNTAMIETLSKQFTTHFNVNHRCHCTLVNPDLPPLQKQAQAEQRAKIIPYGWSWTESNKTNTAPGTSGRMYRPGTV